MYHAEILLDSISPNGTRLTTMRVTMPRILLAELNTHRRKSRNAGSSRAIPIGRRLKQVRENPFIPIEWGQNQKGMQAEFTISAELVPEVEAIWREAAASAASFAERLNDYGVHKQVVNRLLEPFVWVTVIISATEWQNFFRLRVSKKAQPEMAETARVMKAAYDGSTPTPLQWGDWHVPCVDGKFPGYLKVSAGRMARVSYETEGKPDVEEIDLANRLTTDEHWSPFEHIAECQPGRHDDCRNYVSDWRQYRAYLDSNPANVVQS